MSVEARRFATTANAGDKRAGLEPWHPLTTLSLAASLGLLAFLPWPRLPAGHAGALALIALCAALTARAGRAPLRQWVQRLVLIVAPLALSLALVQGLFFPGASDILFTLGPLSFFREGLHFTLTISARLLVMVGAALFLTQSTRTSDLVLALTQSGLPPEVGYVLLGAAQLIPQTRRRAAHILDAQRARGLALDGPLQRVRALAPLALPLLFGALHDAQMRALALDARAFRAPGSKTSLRQLHDSAAQRTTRWSVLGGSLLMLVLTHTLRA